MASPSNLVRAALFSQLSDPATGFNPVYASVYGGYPGVPLVAIDFAGPKSLNFVLGRISPDQLEETGTIHYPLMALYAVAGRNGNLQKFRTFAGIVKGCVDMHLSGGPFKASKALYDYESWGDAVEETMISVVNNLAVQNWGPGVTYNGGLGYERMPVDEAGENWRTSLHFEMTFEVII